LYKLVLAVLYFLLTNKGFLFILLKESVIRKVIYKLKRKNKEKIMILSQIKECYIAVIDNYILKNPPFALRIETKGGTNA